MGRSSFLEGVPWPNFTQPSAGWNPLEKPLSYLIRTPDLPSRVCMKEGRRLPPSLAGRPPFQSDLQVQAVGLTLGSKFHVTVCARALPFLMQTQRSPDRRLFQ